MTEQAKQGPQSPPVLAWGVVDKHGEMAFLRHGSPALFHREESASTFRDTLNSDTRRTIQLCGPYRAEPLVSGAAVEAYIEARVRDAVALEREGIADLAKAHANAVAERDALRTAIGVACDIIELGDHRLLATDGPVNGMPPDLTLAEWRKLYVTLDATRNKTPKQEATDARMP